VSAPGVLPDVIADGLPVLFCGINPGLLSAATGHHFAGRGNRFWQVIHLAGFTPDCLSPEHDRLLLRHGCGLTTVVARASARADQVALAEFHAASRDLERKIADHAPRTVAFLGKGAWSALSGLRNPQWGPQSARLAGAAVWLLPNPSGRNRAFTLDRLVEAYYALRKSDTWEKTIDPRRQPPIHAWSAG